MHLNPPKRAPSRPCACQQPKPCPREGHAAQSWATDSLILFGGWGQVRQLVGCCSHSPTNQHAHTCGSNSTPTHTAALLHDRASRARWPHSVTPASRTGAPAVAGAKGLERLGGGRNAGGAGLQPRNPPCDHPHHRSVSAWLHAEKSLSAVPAWLQGTVCV